jgi:hypothetical protein
MVLNKLPNCGMKKFDKVVVANGFKIHNSNKCVYSKFHKNQGVIICLYVDDMLIFGIDFESIENTKNFLSSSFDMKDLCIANVILGIRIVRNENGLVFNQSHYIEKVLKRFNQFDYKPVCTPFDASMKLYPNTDRAVNQLEYARVIGCLMYAMTCTRPDIAYAVGKISRYTSNPVIFIGMLYIGFLDIYLRRTMDYGILHS